MTLTFADSGVLIAASRTESAIAERALAILTDDARSFAASEFVKLEVLPKAIYNKQAAEVAFYEAFFESVSSWAVDLSGIVREGYRIASTYGISAVDALHIAAALQVGAAELITTERASKPIHRVTAVQVISIWAG